MTRALGVAKRHLQIRIQERVLKRRCCHQLVLQFYRSLSAFQIDTAIARLRARCCVVIQFENVYLIGRKESAQFLSPIVGVAAVKNEEQSARTRLRTPKRVHKINEHPRVALLVVDSRFGAVHSGVSIGEVIAAHSW